MENLMSAGAKSEKKIDSVGSRAQVWHGNALHTTGGLHKRDLKMNKHGRIVSMRKSVSAKREKRLEKAGFFTKKGHFGYVKKEDKDKKKKSMKKSMKKSLKN